MVNTLNTTGDTPHRLSDGGGVVGVYLALGNKKNISLLRIKNKPPLLTMKKKLNFGILLIPTPLMPKKKKIIFNFYYNSEKKKY
jgi:hypothetical protein